MRGILMDMNKRHRCKQEQKRKELEDEIRKSIKRPEDKVTKEGVKILRKQFDLLMADQVARNIQYAKHRTFRNSNKPGRWLAYVLRKKQKSRIIEKIAYKGKEEFQQETIKKAFTEFYSKLYAEEKTQDKEIDKFLQNEKLLIITNEQRDSLNALITQEEILSVIKQLKKGKSPGTDGLTATYYKYLREEMIEPLRELFVNIQEGGQVPPSWKTAYISLIPKEGKDNVSSNF